MLSKLGKRRQVVIPKAICEQLRLEEGDYVEVDLKDNMVIIKPKKLVDADEILTPKEAAIVKQGETQLQRGEGTSWENVKENLKL